MPEMDGLDATRHIRQLDANRGVPIVALTADVLNREPGRQAEAGLDDYLPKPVTELALHRILEKWGPAHGKPRAVTRQTEPSESAL
jgi:CheY-like chemotaxis protein